MTFRVVRANLYNQDLGLIHSTIGNHLESSNEGSSIDHQVTIDLHAKNITMFPTNETWKPIRDDKKRPDRSANKERKEKNVYRKRRKEKAMVAEENKSVWTDLDSEESQFGISSSSESEDEVQCLMADDTEELFDFSNPEFTRQDLITALNEIVIEYRNLYHSFEEVKAEKESCETRAELVGSSNMQAALSFLPHYTNCMELQSHPMIEPEWAPIAMKAVQQKLAALQG
ncbi:hypothetical protein F511_38923 [Dorcoceras hygrometricum]|uniref:Uncharacterized protein n=1 Tax=Dorcoceras hygrometricum TaxID=472368 RepID=A0A2Z7BUN0_9LAMI|nr:hypothetical protein F511_38923 [Dorcoceras hygrometricum]